MGTVRSSIGDSLRRYRIEAGLNQQQLADRAGMSVRALRDMEHGRVRRPRTSSVQALATALRLGDSDHEWLQQLTGRTEPHDATLRVQVLGPLSVHLGRTPVDISSPMLRSLLGLLAIQVDDAVTTAEIVDVLWGENPPRSWRNLIHVYVARLRAILDAASEPAVAPIVGRTHRGYQLLLDVGRVDLVEFRQLLEESDRARTAADPDTALELVDRALECWKGPVLSDCQYALNQHPTAVAAASQRLAATIVFADLCMEQHHYNAAIERLVSLTREHPLHEGLHARLVLALAGSGQQAMALLRYRTIADRLVSELGVDPGRELQEAQVAVLRQQLSLCRLGPVRVGGPGTRRISHA